MGESKRRLAVRRQSIHIDNALMVNSVRSAVLQPGRVNLNSATESELAFSGRHDIQTTSQVCGINASLQENPVRTLPKQGSATAYSSALYDDSLMCLDARRRHHPIPKTNYFV